MVEHQVRSSRSTLVAFPKVVLLLPAVQWRVNLQLGTVHNRAATVDHLSNPQQVTEARRWVTADLSVLEDTAEVGRLLARSSGLNQPSEDSTKLVPTKARLGLAAKRSMCHLLRLCVKS